MAQFEVFDDEVEVDGPDDSTLANLGNPSSSRVENEADSDQWRENGNEEYTERVSWQ